MVLGCLSAVFALSEAVHFCAFRHARDAPGKPSQVLHSLSISYILKHSPPSCAPDLVLTSLFEPQAAAPSSRPEPRCATLSPFPRSGVLNRLLRAGHESNPHGLRVQTFSD